MHVADFLVEQITEFLVVVAVLGGDEDAVFIHLGHPSRFQLRMRHCAW